MPKSGIKAIGNVKMGQVSLKAIDSMSRRDHALMKRVKVKELKLKAIFVY
jgi:phage FluMu protein gp41